MRMLDAIENILRKENRPLTAKEISEIAIKSGLIKFRGKTPWASVGARIYVDLKTKGADSKFKKVGKGKFALRDSTPQFKKNSFKGAAFQVLREEGRPLRSEEILALAQKRGLLKTSGKTPWATMAAQLYMDVKSKKSPFVQLGKNRFGLRELDLSVIKKEIEAEENRKLQQEARFEKKRSIVGEPINFGGLVYGPLNENGVIFLFAKLQNKLGIVVESIQATFPDARGRRKTPRGWEEVWIEFEYKSSHFKQHGHDPKECDIIVCWEHDWPDCPLEVIELKKLVNSV
ncbi:MAG: winged helix-turn-helix domain-containing protein [Candidatus Bilamarchaeaceae archaeon]